MSPITHLWTRLTSARHEDAWIERLRFAGPEFLVIKAFPASRTLRLQLYTNQAMAKRLLKLFGGSVRPFNAATWTPPNIKRSSPLRIAGGLRLHNDRKTFLADRKLQTGKAYPLLIPASMAFGTGEHATTRSCLRILSRIVATLPTQPWSLLDLGTGSGILALAAELLGAQKILGIDFDERCIKVAQENATENQLSLAKFCHADLLQWKIPGTWNVVAANIYSTVLSATAPKIVKAIAPNGHLILSGILACEAEEVETLFSNLGMRKSQRIIQGKWAAIHFGLSMK